MNEQQRLNSLRGPRIFVRIIEARGLKAADFFGTSDPFVEVRLKGHSEFYKTKVIKKTVCPFWNEEFILNPTNLGSEYLHLKIYDYDTNTLNDLLGEVEVPIMNLINNPNEQWLQVMKRSGFSNHHGKGEIKVQVRMDNSQMQQPMGYPPQQPMGYPPQQYPPQQPYPTNPYPPQQTYPPQQPPVVYQQPPIMTPPIQTYPNPYPPQHHHTPQIYPQPPVVYSPPTFHQPPVVYQQPPIQTSYYPGVHSTSVTYVTVPQMYNRMTYSYPSVYIPGQPFVMPMGLPPHLVGKMMQASQVFRMFDTNYNGVLSKKEWKRAMWQLGYCMSKHDAKRLFFMIDRDHSGHISEREFCEYWISTH